MFASADGTEASEESSPSVLEKEEVGEEGDREGDGDDGGGDDNTSTENMVSFLFIFKLSRAEPRNNFDNFLCETRTSW